MPAAYLLLNHTFLPIFVKLLDQMILYPTIDYTCLKMRFKLIIFMIFNSKYQKINYIKF